MRKTESTRSYQPIDNSGHVSSGKLVILAIPTIEEALSIKIRNKIKEKPEYALNFAVLKQSIIDVGIIRHGNSRRMTSKKIWKESVDWFNDQAEHPFSFKWIAYGFEMDPSAVLRNLNKIRCEICDGLLMQNYCRCKIEDRIS